MSNVTISGNASGTATFTVQSPATSTNRTLTLPDATGTMPMFQSGTAVASTSGTSIDFTGIPSWAKRVTVMFQGVSTNGTSNIQIQLGTSSGVTTSGYLGGSSTFNAITVAALSSGIVALVATSAADVWHGQTVISNITGNAWSGSGLWGRQADGAMRGSAGTVSLSATLDRVRITTVNGTDTFDAGTINIMWEG